MKAKAKPDTQISIHALREEGDHGNFGGFNYGKQFLSTPSARRATPGRMVVASSFDISIHALREEGDATTPFVWSSQRIFLSTPSARRATPCLPVSRPA